MFRCLCGALALLTFAGCSTLEKIKEEPDTTPSNSTAVLETHLVSDGIKGFLPFEGTSKAYTRADMHRDDSVFKGTGTVTRFLVGTNNHSRIERLDKKVIYTLDVKEKTYTECPLKGCGGPVDKPAKKEPEEKKAEEKPKDTDCKVKIASAAFNVKQTGQKKSINGFDTEQYQAVWLVTLQDPTARKTVSTLNVDVWTTPVTAQLKEANAIEQAYARNFANALVTVATNGQKTQVVPEEAAKVINAYISRLLTPADRAAFLKAGTEIQKIKGYPIMTQLAWNLKGDACASTQADGGSDKSSSSKGDLMSSITDYFAKKKVDEATKDFGDKPIFSFTAEVKSHKVEAVHDSVFLPPKNYTQSNAK
ncbi:MAG TPA: hypothetical protein VHB46_17415 [Burkholderiales bacterium]|nr:hypothetical protein [Burkholderiales bacterium]